MSYTIFCTQIKTFFIYHFAYIPVYTVNIVHCLTSERKNNNKANLSFCLKSIRAYNSQYLQFTSSIFNHLLSTLSGRNNDMFQALYFKFTHKVIDKNFGQNIFDSWPFWAVYMKNALTSILTIVECNSIPNM